MHGAIYTCMGFYMATDDLLLKSAKTGAACSCYFLLKYNFSDITQLVSNGYGIPIMPMSLIQIVSTFCTPSRC